jgi:hypothetical protein
MARSKRTQAKATPATPATTSARRTQAPQPTSEDPPDQGSRRSHTSASAKSSRNNQATQQNDDEADDEESDDEVDWKAEMQADARLVLTVEGAESRIEMAKDAIRDLKGWQWQHDAQANLEKARYEREVFRQRRGALRAARVSDDPGDARKGKAKGKAGAQSVPETGRQAASAPAVESEAEIGPEDEPQQPPLRGSSGHRDGQASQSAADNQDPAGPDSDDNLPSQQT